MDKIDALISDMVNYYSGDPKRIQHFIKVHAFAKLIGEAEKLDAQTLFTLEAAAVVHDIGIKPAEKKYGSSSGKLQEKEGPGPARLMLTANGFEENTIARVCFLVGHHHTYTGIDGKDYRILVEADFLVNLYEDSAGKDAINSAYEKIFKTETGKKVCKKMFGL